MSKLLPSKNFKGVFWKIQDSDPESILFYDLKKTQDAYERLEKYLEHANFKYLILSNSPPFPLPKNCKVLEEDNFMQAQIEICDELYPIHNEKKIIGVTGTNGKTTTTFLAQQIANQNGLKSFSLGSIGVWSNRDFIKDLEGMTTPPIIDLRKALHKGFENCDYCFMEVSSHALKQGRVKGLNFVSGAWTNFTQDHLDYHGGMDDYFKSKYIFISDYLKDPILVPHNNIELQKRLKKFEIDKSLEERQINLSLPFFNTKYNQENIEIALSLVEKLIGDTPIFNESDIMTPPGRFEFVEVDEKKAIIDFAHTPDAIKNVLTETKDAFPDKKIITIFGCGGDRDPSKRSIMGEVVSQLSDEVIVTSDNPRTEDPEKIIDEIITGIAGDFKKIIDRRESIKFAKSKLTKNDILVILGKGAETYQIVGLKKQPFEDKKVFLEV